MHDTPTHDILSDSEEEMSLPQEDPAEDPEETPVMGQDMDPEDGYDPDDDEEMEEEPALADTVPPPSPSDATPPPAQPTPSDATPPPAQPTPSDPTPPPAQPTAFEPIPPLYSYSHYPLPIGRWDWVPETLLHWRIQEGDPYRGVIYPTELVFPITLEPPHHTLPLLIARISRYEHSFSHLAQRVETSSDPTHLDQIQEDLWRLEHDFQNLRDVALQMLEIVSADQERWEMTDRRLDHLEHHIAHRHASTDGMGGTSQQTLSRDHRRRH